MKRFSADVVVIGTGAAGMMAALAANENGADVVVVGKGAVGKGTCSSIAGGIFSAASVQFTPDEHYAATMEVGRGINDPALVELVTRRGGEYMEKLKAMGAPLLPLPQGYTMDNSGNSKEFPGMVLVDSMRDIMDERGIGSVPGFHCLDLIMEDDRITGILGITADGPAVISASSVVLASGGAGAIYKRNDNPAGITGDGYAMVLKAGCRLQDMEFVQFYPVGIAQPGLPEFIFLPPYPAEAKVLDAQGRNVLEELEGCNSLTEAIMLYRDTGSLLFYRKHMEGGLFLDLTEVEESTWSTMHSLRLLAKNKYDFRNQKFGIAPITHFFIGGMVVNTDMETSIPGLYAAGEVTGGFHGANRMGGNALTECIVCGDIAGVNAASFSRESKPGEVLDSTLEGITPPWASEKGRQVRPEYRELFKNIKRVAWENAGVLRSGEGMRQGLSAISQMQNDLQALSPGNISEGLRHHQIDSALLTLRCVLESGLRREESRGAFYREDFPEIDDANWRRNIITTLDSSTGKLVLEDKPVPTA